jgi:hypothetical protein
MRLKKKDIQIKTNTEQEGIYRGKRSTPTYTVSKTLSIFLESIHFGFFENLFGLLERRRQNLTKVM